MQISKRLFDLFCHPSNKDGFFPLSELTEEELEIFIKTKYLVENPFQKYKLQSMAPKKSIIRKECGKMEGELISR